MDPAPTVALIRCPYAAAVLDRGAFVPHPHSDGLHHCTQQIPAGGDHLGEHTCTCGVAFVVTAALRLPGSLVWSVNPPASATAVHTAPPVDGLVYLLWSQAHAAWWKPNGFGYHKDIDEAGRFSEADAVRYVVASAQSGQRDKVSFMVAAPDNWQRRPADEPRHIIDLREDGWTIQHPLSCRPDLFSCPVNRVVSEELRDPLDFTGRFEVGLNDDGDTFVIGDRVEDVTS